MGLSLLTALEIFNHPNDLEIVVTEDPKTRKYAIGFFRGPGHCGKPLLDSEFQFTDKQEAIAAIKKILEAIVAIGKQVLGNNQDPVAQIVNPEDLAIDDTVGINKIIIDRTVKELEEKRSVATYDWFMSMEEPQKKLMNLERYIPDTKNPLLYPFGKYLAKQFGNDIMSIYFIAIYKSAVQRIEKGNETVPSECKGYSMAQINALMTELPLIANKVLPARFADEVQALLQQPV